MSINQNVIFRNNDQLVSVIVPVYNAERYLSRCVESIIQQDYTNLEIILVNDGSKDESLLLCGHYAGMDDVDIAMPVDDARRFRELMIKHNPSDEYVIQCNETDPGYFGFWDVLRDIKTEYIQDSNMHNRRKYKGLQIDIFPMRKRISRRLLKISLSLAGRMVYTPQFRDLNSKIYFKYNLVRKIVFPFFVILSYVSKKPYYMLDYGSMWEIKYPLKSIYPLCKIKFEGYEFNSPSDVDKYLKNTYGDWRKIPNSEDIQTHNVKIIFKD